MSTTRTSPAADARITYGGRALADMPGCAIVLGERGRIQYANEAARSVMGIGPYVDQAFGLYFSENANPENDAFYELFVEAVRNKGLRHQGRVPFVAPDGTRYTFFVTSSLIQGQDGQSFLVITCADVSAEEELERQRRESTFVFLASIVYICVIVFCYAFWNYFGRPFEPPHFTELLEVLGVILGFIVYQNTSLTLADLGLGTKNLARNLKTCGIASLIIVGVMAGLKLLLMNVAPQVIVHPEAFYSPSWVGPGRFFGYIFTALIQEFLSRGIMQESLTHVIAGEHNESLAIIISTLMFAALHLHYSPFFMIGAAVLLGVFGVVYRRQRSIWGLVLVHFTFGMSAAMLGLI